MIELAGKRVVVLGLGVTGRGVARFLAARGARLCLIDQRADIDRDGLPPGAELHLGPELSNCLSGADLVIPSPGVARDYPLLREAVAARIPVLSELELASRFLAGPLVAITGTNGKSTVTVMLGEVLKAAGMQAFVGGNLGTPLIDAIGAAHDVAVVEVSSFQLEWIESFRPHVAIHLNLTDDHLYRYRDLEEYGRFKARIFENQNADDFAIINRDDPHVWRLNGRLKARTISFGLSQAAAPPAIQLDRDALVFDDGTTRRRVGIGALKIPGRHNLANATAVAAAAMVLGVDAKPIERVFAEFTGLAHRIEFVRERNGVTFVDDSKGTNVGATVEAIAAVAAPIIWIAGGVDKGGDYSPLRVLLKEKVRRAILIGEARYKMQAALSDVTEVELTATLADAVARAAAIARRGDTILLSPACSSFDQFRNYEERGRIFKELARAL
ncbi:MAG: UDP-N-acetylmuramoyl-L-alanine--D-glutamate ligase [Candidatus Binataceae bacterium]|jgi:UDP-N-acetylmuramoylalanine--D-glutamate ligase